MKVFDRMLEIAVMAKVEGEQKIRRVFVFKDMKESGGDRRWEAGHKEMRNKFEGAGNQLPEIMIWNLTGSGRMSM